MEEDNKDARGFIVQFDEFNSLPILHAECDRTALKRHLLNHMIDTAHQLLIDAIQTADVVWEKDGSPADWRVAFDKARESQSKSYPAVLQFGYELGLLACCESLPGESYQGAEELALANHFGTPSKELGTFLDQACDNILSNLHAFLYGVIADAVEFGLVEAFSQRNGPEALRKSAIADIGNVTRIIFNACITRPLRNRPKNTATIGNENLKDCIEEVIKSFSSRSRKPTQLEVLDKLRTHPVARKRRHRGAKIQPSREAQSKDAKTLRNLLARCGLTWKEALQMYWNPPSGK